MDQPETTVTQPTSLPTTQTEEVKSNPNPKSKHKILKSFGVVFLLVTLFFAGFGSALVLTGFPPAQNSTVITTTTEEKPETDEDVVTSSIPAGFKEVKSEMCNFSTVIPESSNYEEEKEKQGNYEWSILETPYKGNSNYSLRNFSDTIIVLGRDDGIGGGYIPGWVVVECAPANGRDLRQAYSDLESDLVVANKESTPKSYYTLQGYTSKWTEESIVYTESGGERNIVYWLIVKNDLIYRISMIVDSKDKAIQEDTRVVFDSLRF